jgi:hypothetical protein
MRGHLVKLPIQNRSQQQVEPFRSQASQIGINQREGLGLRKVRDAEQRRRLLELTPNEVIDYLQEEMVFVLSFHCLYCFAHYTGQNDSPPKAGEDQDNAQRVPSDKLGEPQEPGGVTTIE